MEKKLSRMNKDLEFYTKGARNFKLSQFELSPTRENQLLKPSTSEPNN